MLSAITFAWLLPLSAGSLRDVLVIDLKKITTAGELASHNSSMPVFALSFSPDGAKLAVVADLWQSGPVPGNEKSRLFVLQVSNPQVSPRIFEVSGALNIVEWSPDGQTVTATSASPEAGLAADLRSGETCKLPRQSRFVAENLAVSIQGNLQARSTRMTFLDANRCRPPSSPSEDWTVDEVWVVNDVSPDRGLVLASRQDFRSEALVVNPKTHRVVWRGPDIYLNGRFADSGRAICAGTDTGRAAKKEAHVRCWDTDTGKQIAETNQIRGGRPLVASSKASRIVAPDYKLRFSVLSDTLKEDGLSRMVVWDFRTGEVAFFPPKNQSFNYPTVGRTEEPYVIAISPNGKYVAEGGNGIIRLKRFEGSK